MSNRNPLPYNPPLTEPVDIELVRGTFFLRYDFRSMRFLKRIRGKSAAGELGTTAAAHVLDEDTLMLYVAAGLGTFDGGEFRLVCKTVEEVIELADTLEGEQPPQSFRYIMQTFVAAFTGDTAVKKSRDELLAKRIPATDPETATTQ